MEIKTEINLINIVDEDFVNYKKPSMFLIFPYCTFKCDKEKIGTCQNKNLSTESPITINIEELTQRYLKNNITKSIVCGGLEPFDSFDELYSLIYTIRLYTNDNIVIYTGYEDYEVVDYTSLLKIYPNIIIKYGRFMDNSHSVYNNVLGVDLSSDNQYVLYNNLKWLICTRNNIELNPDVSHVKKIRDALINNNGYCPCQVVKNLNTKCPCTDFLINGKCHCNLYLEES